MSKHPVTIVVPVYGDWPSLRDCIASLIENVDAKQHNVLLVNDCGPDVERMEQNILKAIKGHGHMSYARNQKNLGFVGTCNRAVNELDTSDNDILLLNSDTITTKGFVEEMSDVLYQADTHGAISPRSNNATIATIPLSAAKDKGIDPQAAYKLYTKLKSKLPRSTVVPVAHGFCMLIRRSLIKKYGLFDTAFGKGYGEEVDFCQRIAKDGYICLLANHAFVFHMEARSFSLETKAKLLEEHNRILWERYPNYRDDVRAYMQKALTFESKLEQAAGYKTSENAGAKKRIRHTLGKHPALRSIVNRARRLKR